MPRSGYVRSIATLSGGQVAAAILPVLAAPILGRLYRPEDYAPLIAYLVLNQLLGIFATLQYQSGVVAEGSDRRAFGLAVVALTLTWALALGVAIAVAVISVTGLVDDLVVGFSYWLVALPLTVICAGVIAVGTAWANRAGHYAFIAKAQIVVGLVSVLLSIAFGVAGFAADGLLAALLVGQFVCCVCFAVALSRVPEARSASCWRARWLLSLAQRHRGYAAFSAPSCLIRSVSERFPHFALIALDATATLGLLGRVGQLMFLPISFVSSSVSKVHFQKAAQEFDRTGRCRDILCRTVSWLALISILPFAIVFVFADQIFAIYLGPNWGGAGDIARALVPAFMAQFICLPVNAVFQLPGSQGVGFVLDVVFLVLVGGVCALAVGHGLGPVEIITWSSLAACAGYGLTLLAAVYVSGGRRRRP